MNLLETLVAQMIPGRSVTVEHSRRFDELLVVATALTLECVVRLAGRVVLVCIKVSEQPQQYMERILAKEELFQISDTKVTHLVCFGINHGCRQGLLVCLALEDLLFDSTSRPVQFIRFVLA